VRTVTSLVRTDVGFSKDDRVLTFGVYAPPSRYPTLAGREAFYETVRQRVRSLPGVRFVGSTFVAPWQGGWTHVGFRVQDRPIDESSIPSIEYGTASPEYFSAAGIPLRAGRSFVDGDRVGSQPVVVVSDAVARRFWPNGDAIGAHVRLDGAPGDSMTVFQIVGVVGDVRHDVQSSVSPMVYGPNAQTLGSGGAFVVRTNGDARVLKASIAELIHSLDTKFPPLDVRTMRDVLTATIVRQRLAMGLLATFAFLALVLAALGVYSVMAYAVLARTREFGIRSALGARRMSILVLVLRQAGGTILVGVGGGLALALALSRFVRALLVGVSVHDPVTFMTAGGLLTIVAVTACLAPARSATRIQPVDALRAD
jgi:predicted permease